VLDRRAHAVGERRRRHRPDEALELGPASDSGNGSWPSSQKTLPATAGAADSIASTTSCIVDGTPGKFATWAPSVAARARERECEPTSGAKSYCAVPPYAIV
jgi:hypothetical protein